MRQPRPAEPGLVHIYDPALGLPAIPKEVRVTDPVYDQAYFDQEKRAESARTLAAQFDSKEVRVTDAKTGGQKGKKMARFSLIPPEMLWALAEHYGKGAEKYNLYGPCKCRTGTNLAGTPHEVGCPAHTIIESGDRNWEKGYNWSLSVDALERHLNQWKQGEDRDPETGSHHLIAVIWHATALFWYQLRGKGTDDLGRGAS